MSKMMKTIGKLKLWTLLGVVLIVAGIVIAAVFGFNADTTASDYKTLSVKLDSYETGARVERIDEICTGEIDKAGLTVIYSQKNEFSNSSCEMLVSAVYRESSASFRPMYCVWPMYHMLQSMCQPM